MVGTALTFAVGIGLVVSAVGGVAILRHKATIIEVMRTGGRFSVASFILGFAFSGILALAARGRGFRRLSLPLVTSLGAGAGLLYWLVLAFTGGRNWGPGVGLFNFVLLLGMGGGAAAAMLLIARYARSTVEPNVDAEPGTLGSGDPELAMRQRDAEKVSTEQRRE